MTCGSANSQRRAVSGRTSTPSGLIELRVRHVGLRQIAGTSPFLCTRLTGQSSESGEDVKLRYSFSVEILLRRRGLASGSELGRFTARGEPPGSRFFLSHFRPSRTSWKTIGPLSAARSSCGGVRFVNVTRLSDMAAAANRLTTKTMIGFRFGGASAIFAARPSPSCRGSHHLTPTTASSPAAKRCGAISSKAVHGRRQRPWSKIPIASPILPRCAAGFGLWIPHSRRFRSCVAPCALSASGSVEPTSSFTALCRCAGQRYSRFSLSSGPCASEKP
jgi:hypothetical protein